MVKLPFRVTLKASLGCSYARNFSLRSHARGKSYLCRRAISCKPGRALLLDAVRPYLLKLPENVRYDVRVVTPTSLRTLVVWLPFGN